MTDVSVVMNAFIAEHDMRGFALLPVGAMATQIEQCVTCPFPIPNTHPFNFGVLTVTMSACQSGLGSYSKSANVLLQLKDFDLLIGDDQNHMCSLCNSKKTLESLAVVVCGHECVCSAFLI